MYFGKKTRFHSPLSVIFTFLRTVMSTGKEHLPGIKRTSVRPMAASPLASWIRTIRPSSIPMTAISKFSLVKRRKKKRKRPRAKNCLSQVSRLFR